jgi:hypothetical protein
MANNYMTEYNVKELLENWLSHGLIEQDQWTGLENFSIGQQQARELPLYLHVFAGVGAFIATLCFMGFLYQADIIDFELKKGLIIWGVLFMIGAILVAMGSGNKLKTVRHSFSIQTSFCFIGTGKILFVIGIARAFQPNEEWGVTLATLLVTLATYHVYPMSIDRFLSSLAVLVSIFYTLITTGYGYGLHGGFIMREIFLNVFFVAQLAIAAVLATNGRIRRGYMPLAYAFIFSLCVAVIFFAARLKIGHWLQQHDFSLLVMNASLAITLVALAGWAAGGWDRLYKSEPLLLVSVGSVLLALISAPGILLSIELMALGYARHERLLLLLGALLFPLFISLYYYNLDLTLMAKSSVLVASGCLLLVGRAYLHYRGFDGEA